MISRSEIRDLSPGSVNQTFLLTKPTLSETKTGKPFLRCTFRDKTGEISGITWDTSELPASGVYRVFGMLEQYQGALSLKVSSMEPVEDDASAFVRVPSVSLGMLRGAFEDYLTSIGGEYGEVVRCIFSDPGTLAAFTEGPASAAYHHGYKHGLLEHTVSMAKLCREVATHYNFMYGAGTVDSNLLVAGAILHDLGKIYELDSDGIDTEYTVGGMLVGHISECVTMVHDACMATLASPETRERLIHMVLSHHGQLEYGSPVTPRLLEAQLLHMVDMMDSRTAMFREATEGLELGQMTGWVKPLGGRAVR